jgi:tetratricopeptide (TPR) repeat protein
MNEPKFAVSRFQNRNGVTSWRVSGWLHGVRIRKNFLTKEEAAAEKATLEIKAVQVSAGFRPAMTLLTDAQLRDAEASWHRLQGKPQPLSFYVDYALANYRPPEHQKPLAAAVAIYLAERTKAFEQDMLSPRQLRSIRNELEALQTHFPKATVCQFTAPILRAYLERGDSVLKTYNNRRGVLSTFFKFSFQHDWIASNPVERTPHHRINHRRGSAVTITAEKAKELMAYVETFRGAALVTYFAICLFAGIRPCIRGGEIKKLKAESVRLDTRVIHIEPEVSKVRMKRNVTIQPNLAAWLRAYPEALKNLGLALAQSGRPAERLEFIERSLALKPGLAEAHKNLGLALAGVSRGEDAVAAFRPAAALNPNFPNIHENAGKLLQQLGRQAEADAHFREARRLRHGSAAHEAR